MAQGTLTVRDGNNTAQTVATFPDLAGNIYSGVSLDSSRQTYRASAASAAVITTAAGTLISIQGSATKTIRIKRIGITLTAATPAQCVLQLQRTSALGAGGTTVSPTVAKLDTNSAAATAVVSHYTTVKQTNGTAVGGPLSTTGINSAVTTTAPTFLGAPFQFLFPESGMKDGQAIVLRGVADFLEVQNPVAIGTTPALSYFVEWEEDAS